MAQFTHRRLLMFRIAVPVVVLGMIAVIAGQEPQNLPALVTIKGHSEPIYSVVYTPDGKAVITGSFDKTARMWDAKTGKELRSFGGAQGHQSLVLTTAISSNGASLATGGADNTAKVWDIPVNAPVREFAAADGVNAVAVGVDGKTVAGACKDGTVKVWTTADSKQVANLTGHPGGATGVAISANGQTIVSGGMDGVVRFWNATNGQPLGSVVAHPGPITAVGINPNNVSAYSVGQDGMIRYWQLPPVAPRAFPPHADAVNAMYVTPEGASIFTGGADKVVKQSAFATGQLTRDFAGATAPIQAIAAPANPIAIVAGTADGKLTSWTAADGKMQAQVNAHAGGVTSIAFHPNQTSLYTTGADGTVKNWLFPINPSKSIPTPERILASVLSVDAKRMVTSGADKIIRSWAYPAGTAERQFQGHTAPATALALTADGATLISAGGDETIRFWNVANGMETGRINGHVGAITSLAISAQNNILVSGGEDGTVKLWTLPLVPAKPFAHPDAVQSMALSPDGNRLLTVGNDKQARLFNLASGAAERTFTAANNPITAIGMAPDNTTYAIAGADKSLVINRAGTDIKKFPPLPSPASAVAFSTDSTKIAVATGDNTIRLHNVVDPKDVKEPKELKAIPGHTGAIVALAYSVKGDLLISASADKTIRLWNPADGTAKGQLTHTSAISGIALSKDGLKIAAGGADNIVAIWTLADSKPAGTITTPAEVRGVSFNTDGTKLAVAGADNKVRIYGIDGKLQEIFQHDGPTTGVAYLADGKRIVSTSTDKTARIWTTAFILQAAHTGPVRQVAITPAMDRVFSCGDDKHVRIWDAKTAKEIRPIPAHDGPVVGFALSTDLTILATASADKTAKVWTVADGKMTSTIKLAGPAQALALAPNGKRLAVAFADTTTKVRTFDPATGAELQAIADPTAPVRGMTFLADGRTLITVGDDKLIAVADAAVQFSGTVHPGGAVGIGLNAAGTQFVTAGKDKTVKLWDATNGKEVKAFGPPTDAASAIAVSRDFTVIAAASGKVVKVWQVADGKEIASITHPADVVAVNFNADRSRLITGATDNLARVYEVATGRLQQAFSHGGAVRGVAFHPAQPMVLTTSADKTTVATTITNQRVVAASTMPIRSMAVAPAGTQVFTGGDEKTFKAWNTASGAEEKSFTGAEGSLHAVAVSKNGQLAASGGAEKIIRVYTFADAKLLGSITAPAGVRWLAFHPTLPLLTAVCDDKSIQVYSIGYQPGQPLPPEFGKPIQSFLLTEVVQAITIAENGLLYSASLDKTVKQWKIASDAPARNFAHPQIVDAVAFDKPGAQLATGCHDGILRVFDIEKNAATKTINAHVQPQPNPIYAVAWTPDSKQILTASYDKSLKLWDVTSGNMVREFKGYEEKTAAKGHRDQVFSVAFTSNGAQFATGSSDKSVKLWNVADGTVLREFTNPNLKQPDPKVDNPMAHPGWVYSVRFTPDDKHLISVGSGPKNTAYLAVWTVADGKMLYGGTLDVGPIYSVAVSPDGTQLVLGCGSKDRRNPPSDALIIKLPGK